MTYCVKSIYNYKQETTPVTDTSSKTRPDTWRSVEDWVERFVDFSDVVVDDSEEIMDTPKIDTCYNDKLDLAQQFADARDYIESLPHNSSSPAEQNTGSQDTTEDVSSGEVKPDDTGADSPA